MTDVAVSPATDGSANMLQGSTVSRAASAAVVAAVSATSSTPSAAVNAPFALDAADFSSAAGVGQGAGQDHGQNEGDIEIDGEESDGQNRGQAAVVDQAAVDSDHEDEIPLRSKIMKIHTDLTLSPSQRAKKVQRLMLQRSPVGRKILDSNDRKERRAREKQLKLGRRILFADNSASSCSGGSCGAQPDSFAASAAAAASADSGVGLKTLASGIGGEGGMICRMEVDKEGAKAAADFPPPTEEELRPTYHLHNNVGDEDGVGNVDGDCEGSSSSASSATDNDTVSETSRPPQRTAILGCKHYARGCKYRAACCGAFFGCRFCHDEAVGEDHTVDRYATKEMLCMHCGEVQVGLCSFSADTGWWSR